MGLGVEFIEGHFVFFLDVLTIVQLLNVDLIVVFILFPVLQVLPVVLIVVLRQAVVDTVDHLLHILKSILMWCAINCFDIVRCPNLDLSIPSCVGCHSYFVLELVWVACLVSFVIIYVSLAHLRVGLAHFLFIVSVVHVPLLRINLCFA